MKINIYPIWRNLLLSYNIEIVDIIYYWSQIIRKYNSNKRFYHNLEHIQNLILLQNNFFEKITNNSAVLFSIFFHDFHYDIKRHDNELKSAEYAQTTMQAIDLPEKLQNLTYKFILATSNHQIDKTLKFSEQTDLKYFLDFDLSILGSSTQIYKKYINNIRKEYSIYSDKQFFAGRKLFIEKMLSKKSLFYTHELNNLFQEQAKINLTYEKNHLF